jgi:hypothetical protein
MKTFNLLLVLGLLLAAAGCVPVVQDMRPKVAFINAPTEDRVTGLAEELETLIKPSATPFGFSRVSALRFQETHRDMAGSRAPLQAAFIARSQGAVYAVMVGFENDGEVVRSGLEGDRLELTLRLKGRAKASIIDPTTAEVLATFESSEIMVEQYETVTLALPEGLSPLDPRAQSIVAQQTENAKVRALERFLKDNAKQPLSEVAEPLTNELTTLTSLLQSRN